MDGNEKSKKSSPSTWKAHLQRRMATKKIREEKAQEETKSQKKESLLEGGSILVENVFEPLQG